MENFGRSCEFGRAKALSAVYSFFKDFAQALSFEKGRAVAERLKAIILISISAWEVQDRHLVAQDYGLTESDFILAEKFIGKFTPFRAPA